LNPVCALFAPAGCPSHQVVAIRLAEKKITSAMLQNYAYKCKGIVEDKSYVRYQTFIAN